MLKLTVLNHLDEPLFRDYVNRFRNKDNNAFEDSWVYTIQATRLYPRKYQERDGLVLLTKDPSMERIVVVNWFLDSVARLKEIVDEIVEAQKKPVVIKNVRPKELAELVALGFETYTDDECWSTEARYDDQTLPQRIVEIDTMLLMKGSTYKDLRWELKSLPELSVLPYRISEHYKNVDMLLHKQDSRLDGEAYDAHKLFLEMERDVNKEVLVFLRDDKLTGFTLSDRISESCAAFNALIFDADIPNAASALTVETARKLKRFGYHRMNFQGSESKGLDDWKIKFGPTQTLERTHLIYR